MHPRLSQKLARWAAAAALVIAVTVGGIFARRQWLASREARHVPSAVPAHVQQRSLKFTFSKVDGRQTVFTIHAARATQYSGGSGSVLEDVDILVKGEHGERHDEIHTRSCEYRPENGQIVCHGKVNLSLSSVPLARTPGATPVGPSARGKIQLETRGVTFNRDAGTATTAAPVMFRFPEGEGSAEGAEYSSRGADFVLRRNVQIRLTAGRSGTLPTVVTAKGGLTFDRRSNQLRMSGPVEIQQGGRRIDAEKLTVELNNRLRPQRAVLAGKIFLRMKKGPRADSLQAQSAEILFDPQGRAERLNAGGRVVVIEEAPEQIRLRAQHATIALDPSRQQPRTAKVDGEVHFEQKRGADVFRLNAGTLRMAMAPIAPAAPEAKGSRGVRLAGAVAPDGAQVEWQSKDEKLLLKSRELRATFGPDNQLELLRGAGGVRIERREAQQAPVVTTAQNLVAHFTGGSWTDTEVSGNVRAAQGARRGGAGRATWVRAEDTLELAGRAHVSDPSGQVYADTIAWNQKTGVLHATGHVHSSYSASAGPENRSAYGAAGVAGAVGPVNVVAATLDANSKTGKAIYTGSVRLWAGNLVVQANRIALQRDGGELVATGNVLAAMPQAVLKTAHAAKSKGEAAANLSGEVANKSRQQAPVLWRVKTQRLRYLQGTVGKQLTGQAPKGPNGAEGKVTLDGGVVAWSSQGRIEAKTMVLTLKRGVNGHPELTQAIGSGGVTVRQRDRWGTAENASYDAETGKIVLWGGKPSLRDAAGDLVTGNSLTFSVSNDTISVESSEGSRTLTRYPVTNR